MQRTIWKMQTHHIKLTDDRVICNIYKWKEEVDNCCVTHQEKDVNFEGEYCFIDLKIYENVINNFMAG